MITLTEHGLLRGSQRAISKRQMKIVVDNGIAKWHKGRKLYFMRDKDIQRCLNAGYIKKQEADKLHNLTIVIELENMAVVSAYKARGKKQKQILRCG